MAQASFRLFYRIVRTNPPTIADFMSNAAKGKRPRHPEPEVLRLWDGLSAYSTVEQARATAQLFPRLGRYIATVRVPEPGTVQFEQTRDPAEGHFTLWGEPAEMLALVMSAAPVETVH